MGGVWGQHALPPPYTILSTLSSSPFPDRASSVVLPLLPPPVLDKANPDDIDLSSFGQSAADTTAGAQNLRMKSL